MEQRRRRRLLIRIGLPALVLAIVGGGSLAYAYYAQWESTDDAQVDAYIYPLTSRISGYVQRVQVDENQYVEAGTVLVQLDPKDYEVAVANARATMANQEASAVATRLNIPLTSVNTSTQLSSAHADVDNATAGLAAAHQQFAAAQASLRQAEANDLKAQDDVERYRPLAEKDEIPQQLFTQALASEKATAAAVDAAQAAAAAAEQAIMQSRTRVAQAQAALQYAETRPQQISVQQSHAAAAHAQVQQAGAALEQAQLNLQYTTIVAPVSGIVGQRSVQPGQYVSEGDELMSIVPLDTSNIWVTANFKETQLGNMRPGQPVTISVDTYGRQYSGRVDSIAAATGARYSLLPPENATGNYVKVVQRIPVKILFDDGQDPKHMLRPGMSVVPSVKVRE
jgi:membrane fusion protein (multidrug efflux system)